MAYLHEQMKKLKFDVRMQKINIKKGALNKEELEKHLKEIPDSGDKSAPLDFEDKGRDSLL